jgi:hypothetical protein
MDGFDFSAPAEIFASKSRGASRRPMTYHRFPSTAEAVRYAVEVLSSETLFGTTMEVDGARFDAREIRRLYEHADYPLQRSAAA